MCSALSTNSSHTYAFHAGTHVVPGDDVIARRRMRSSMEHNTATGERRLQMSPL